MKHTERKQLSDRTLNSEIKSVVERSSRLLRPRRSQEGGYLFTMSSSLLIPTALGLLLFLLHTVTSSDEQDGTLRLIHVIFRHGHRTPADTYPNDPYAKHSFEPFGWGQLTNVGKRAQFAQGEFLRRPYDSFLGDRYSPDYLKVQCTDVDRTKMSTMLFLAGLFPPKGDQVWNPNLLWQPIPLNYETMKYDRLLLGRYPCPRYQEELDNVFNSPEVRAILEANKNLLDYASKESGMPIVTPDDAQSLYSTLKAERELGLTLPAWTNAIFPDPLSKITAQSFVINAMTPVLQRLKGGFLLKKIIEDTNDKLSGRTKMKMFVYGAHDSTIANFLLTLGVWDMQIPEYNSLIILEVHQLQPGRHGIRVFLRNTTSEPYLLQIPGCSKICPWENFVSLTSSKIPVRSYDEECQALNPNFVYRESSGGP
ncbi:hypothetical protein M8J76_003432 [Diaphorina citri]|nr:hypothetical protein M8J75_000719 [Diaphorina citri]KAI5748934.1 hypothetical protein M8J76_003432 [Diaphorina citri]